jgi:NDP-sugar pyrophosphorylase family protein
MKAVVLAGGKGTRLRPYTISLPKPLMPVGEQPILEIVINQLRNAGITEVIIAVGYLESLIRAFFGDGSRFGVDIEYSSEREPMGTAGPLGLIRSDLNEKFILMNGDVLSDISFPDLIEYHKAQNGLATVALSKRDVQVDFGVIRLDDRKRFLEWQEKPSLTYLVSTGIYVFEPRIIDFIPDGFFNLPDLIVTLHKAGEIVGTYIHEGYWLDIGRIEDYQTACRTVEEKKVNFGNR